MPSSTSTSRDDKHTRPPLHHTTHHDATSSSFADDEPAAKRRKLSIRGKHVQTTLDTSFAIAQSGSAASPPKPPTKVTLAQPHGKLIETVNGVRKTLDLDADDLSLPPSGAGTPKPAQPPQHVTGKVEEKRTLRSADDGPRLKSELAIYFPNYEEVIFDTGTGEEGFVTVDTVIYVMDDAPRPDAKGAKKAGSSPNGILQSPSTPQQRSNSNNFNGSPSLNLDSISRTLPEKPEDPLTDEHFLTSHRRAERKEKQLRNIEKERAMHEKVQLDRLLDGLQGHDWLKVLGITGITDGEAKKYEPKRDYFISEVQALVDKFKQWKEQEKRQRVEKEALYTRHSEGEGEDEEASEEEGSVDPPSSGDLNASAARQLQQETASALKSSLAHSHSSKHKYKPPPPPPILLAPPSPELPITSFYAKPHLRAAALGKSRHGRNVRAFGHPVPELPEFREFELPPDLMTEDALRANAREKRRRKRATVADAGTGAGAAS